MKDSMRERAASVRSRVRRLTRGESPSEETVDPPSDSGRPSGDLHRQVAQLRKRVTELEREVTETQRLSGRVAELVDLVQELLLPAANRDEARLRELLARFDAGS